MLPLFIIFILVALVLQRIFIRSASDTESIRYECRPSVSACEPGAEFLVFSTVQNHARFKTPSILMEEHFPGDLNVLEDAQFNARILSEEGHRIYYSTVVLHRKEQLRRYLRASISRRGEYRFSWADFHAGDFLGFRETSYRIDNDHRIVIYPPKLENADCLRAFSNEMDALALKKQLLEDPISVRGYRDYTGREPMRQISWPQSAVRGRLIVREFDPVWSQSVLVVLDTAFHGGFEQYVPQLEYCYSLTRTVCDILETRQIGYRFLTNAIISSEISSFAGGTGTEGAYARILYALGVAGNGSVCPLEELLHTACLSAARRDVIVFISTRSSPEVENALAKARGYTGGKLLALFAGTPEEGRAAV